ncbi:major facilitator superfamily transporter [Colletotrichum tamarilloi]|uniref:Major facilitator superfamily transporter n=1 Tax=Colletotrichum tamarilloi TaxID=1209934 RepID=A0ABQ9R0J6_9PEZI|nr:major facilitator superfamily transporter [Colletotrichum tamarilloi]KAK1491207.1 major facilitator superfamily transporter [Colletotrichum tamarilloi]
MAYRQQHESVLSTSSYSSTAYDPAAASYTALKEPKEHDQRGISDPMLVDESDSIPEWKPSKHQMVIITTLSIMSFVIALDANVIVTSLSSIIQDIGGTSTQAFWVGTSYLISCAVAMPFLASLSDIFGRPIILIGSLVFFTVGTILCCVSNGIGLLLGGRVIQGIGAGGMYVLSLVVFTDIVPLRHRPKYYGIIQMAWAIGSLTGPIIGGAVAEHTTWRWIFYLNFPICGYSLLAIPILLTLKPPTATFSEKLKRVDWLGGFLFIGSMVTFLVGISWGGNDFPWRSAQTLVPVFIGAAGLTVTLFYEHSYARYPFLKKILFTDRSAITVYVLGLLQGFILYGQLYYIPFYFLSVSQYSPTMAGVAMLPVTLLLLPGSIISGILVSRFNAYRWSIWIGWALMSIASGLLIYWDVDTSLPVHIVTLAIGGIGHGFVLNAQTFVTGAIVEPENSGHAAAMYLFLRMLGCAIGVNVGSTTFQNVMAMKLERKGIAQDIAQRAEEYLLVIKGLADGTFKDAVLESYAFGFKGVHGVYVSLAMIAFFASFMIRHYDLNKIHETAHTLHQNRVSRMFDTRKSASQGRPQPIPSSPGDSS